MGGGIVRAISSEHSALSVGEGAMHSLHLDQPWSYDCSEDWMRWFPLPQGEG